MKLNLHNPVFFGQVESMFQSMERTAQPDSPTPSSFAGFLAALTQPDKVAEDRDTKQTSNKAQDWKDELLADDVATLSYEQALRSHARYHADEPVAFGAEAAPVAPVEVAVPEAEAVPDVSTSPAKTLKGASITIRLSREEDAQLRQRATEAGLTVSAYIRSCTFEAESLRALVKDTLSQLRAGGAPPELESPNRRRGWSTLFWPGRRAAHNTGPNQA
jgi:hypothetical protein